MGYLTFREFVEMKEGATIAKTTGAVQPQDNDQQTDSEIENNPNLLMPQGANPQKVQPIINKAIQTKKMMPQVSLDAAVKAAGIAQKRLASQRPGG